MVELTTGLVSGVALNVAADDSSLFACQTMATGGETALPMAVQVMLMLVVGSGVIARAIWLGRAASCAQTGKARLVRVNAAIRTASVKNLFWILTSVPPG